VIQAAVRRHGRIDVLVNNLGATSPRTGFLAVDDAEWKRVFELTFFSAVRATPRVAPHLLAAGGGAIVNIRLESMPGSRSPMVVDYSAAKAALTNLSKALSEEFAPRGRAHQHGRSRPRPHPILDRRRWVCRCRCSECRHLSQGRAGRGRVAADHGDFHRTGHRA
jgi:hypothetical protein